MQQARNRQQTGEYSMYYCNFHEKKSSVDSFLVAGAAVHQTSLESWNKHNHNLNAHVWLIGGCCSKWREPSSILYYLHTVQHVIRLSWCGNTVLCFGAVCESETWRHYRPRR